MPLQTDHKKVFFAVGIHSKENAVTVGTVTAFNGIVLSATAPAANRLLVILGQRDIKVRNRDRRFL